VQAGSVCPSYADDSLSPDLSVEVAGIEPASFGDLILNVQPFCSRGSPYRWLPVSPGCRPFIFQGSRRKFCCPAIILSAAPWPLGSVVCLLRL
jgi:hypothetical protein